MPDPRPYQVEAETRICAELEQHDSTLLVLATGCGKTVVFSRVGERFRPKGRILVLAHREELLQQAQDKFHSWTGLTTAIEQAGRRDDALFPADVVIGSVQSMCRDTRLARFNPSDFGLVIVDEAHHAISPSYRKVLEHFRGVKRLLVTATPDRLDRAGLGSVVHSVAFNYGLREAIRDRWLSPIRQKRVRIEAVNLRQVKTVKGDFDESQLADQFEAEKALHQVVVPTIEAAGQRPTLLFSVTVDHAAKLTEVINGYRPKSARYLSGDHCREQRADVLDAYRAGEFQFLVGCMLFTEGFDCPPISCVAVARPTKSRALYTQMVGRGTRLADGKEDCLILDFVDNSRHALVINAVDILASDEEADEKKKKLKAKAKARALAEADRGEEIDVLAKLDECELAEERAQAEVKYRAEDVDPFRDSWSRRAVGKPVQVEPIGGDYATAAQHEELKRAKLDDDPLITKEKAAEILEEVRARRIAGQCTVKQGRLLKKYGLDPYMGFKEANDAISALANNNWRMTAQLRARLTAQKEVAA